MQALSNHVNSNDSPYGPLMVRVGICRNCAFETNREEGSMLQVHYRPYHGISIACSSFDGRRCCEILLDNFDNMADKRDVLMIARAKIHACFLQRFVCTH